MDEKVEGLIRMYINISVSPEEIRTWAPARIEKFFAGLAMVLSMKAAIDLIAEGEAQIARLEAMKADLMRARAEVAVE